MVVVGSEYAMWSGHDAHGCGSYAPPIDGNKHPEALPEDPAGLPRIVVGATRHTRVEVELNALPYRWVPRAEGNCNAPNFAVEFFFFSLLAKFGRYLFFFFFFPR